MKNDRRTLAHVTLALALGVAATPALAQDDAGPTPLALGSTAPMAGAALRNVDGKSVTLASVAGKKGTLVFFICNHCPFVKGWQTRIASIGNSARSRGVGVLAINANDPAAYPEDGFAEMQKRAKQVGYKFAYAVDPTSDVARAFGASHTPEVFLFDAAGKLVYHGAIDDNMREPKSVEHKWLEDAVNAVVAGKDVPVAETKALGCGIKFRGKTSS
jgi:cytochrome oxidase Cu insertion factor (SCO1/SenC/PrrC family)